MDLQPLEWEQRRHLSEVQDLWRTLGPLVQDRHQFTGGLTWKKVRDDAEYLARFRTDPLTHTKKFTYLGRRSPETEKTYNAFQRERSDLDGKIEALQRRMNVAARVTKALRLGRMPTQAVDALRSLWRFGLDKHVVVIGSANVYAYELENGLLVPREALPAEDLDLMMLPDFREEMFEDLEGALLSADRSCRFNKPSAEFIGRDGYRIGARFRHYVKEHFGNMADGEAEHEAQDWAFSLPTISAMVLGRDGQPTTGTFLDPRAFLLFSCFSMRAGRLAASQAEPRIEAVASMLREAATEPVPEQFVDLFPILQETLGGMSSPRM